MSLEQEAFFTESLKSEPLDSSAVEEDLIHAGQELGKAETRNGQFGLSEVRRKCDPNMPSIEGRAWSGVPPIEDVLPKETGEKCESLRAKKARVENIVSSMLSTPIPHHPNGRETDSQRRKRKQYQPQPQRDEESEEPEAKRMKSPRKKQEKKHLQTLLHHLQQQLDVLQERYQDLYDEETQSDSGDSADLDDLNEPVDTTKAIRKSELMNGISVPHFNLSSHKDISVSNEKSKLLRNYLKSKLSDAILGAVDNVVDSIIRSPPTPKVKEPSREPTSALVDPKTPSPAPVPVSMGSRGGASRLVYNHSTPVNVEQTEALSLVVPTRIKVPSPSVRSYSKSPIENVMSCKSHPGLATTVAIPNPSLHLPFERTYLPHLANGYDSMEGYRYINSPLLSYGGIPPQMLIGDSNLHSSPRTTPPSIADSYSSFKSDGSASSPPMMPPDLSDYSSISGTNFTATLTPTHLRKAKLMFFFCRYPSSAILRQFFPDVKFNRHNTSQMIKWFSNFREFFYIQMEKFSRQSLSGGVSDPETLEVSRESELFRALNLHYNKSNEYRAPDSFLAVGTTTLREFFKAVKNGRDSEASWKKSIYKVISKLDEPIPTFFRSTNCLDLLQG